MTSYALSRAHGEEHRPAITGPGSVQTELRVESSASSPPIRIGGRRGRQPHPAAVAPRPPVHGSREARWTYGAYSAFTQEKDRGLFLAEASCRTGVTASALTALIDTVNRIVAEPVTDAELEGAKSYIVGKFRRPSTPADRGAIGRSSCSEWTRPISNYREEVSLVERPGGHEEASAGQAGHRAMGDTGAIRTSWQLRGGPCTTSTNPGPWMRSPFRARLRLTRLVNTSAVYVVKYRGDESAT
jgi:hypothetical protein